MAISTSAITTTIVVVLCVGFATIILSCLGGGVLIRRCFRCTTTADEEARERRAANRRNRTLAARMGDGTFVPRDQATVGSNIYNPWAAQTMVPEQPAAPGLHPKPPAGDGGYLPVAYAPGRGYPYQVGWAPPVPAAAASSLAGPPRTSTPPPAYFGGGQH